MSSDLLLPPSTATVQVMEDSPNVSPNERFSNNSFCSVATSVGPDVHSPVRPTVVKPSGKFLFDGRGGSADNEEEDDLWEDDGEEYVVGAELNEEVVEEEEEEEEDSLLLDEETLAARLEAQRRHLLIHGPTRANLDQDRQRLRALRQNQLNNFILTHTKATQASRQDHHIMLRQLIGEAYRRDPNRRENRPHWKRIVAAVRKEYWGANAIFNLSPDPYHNVLAKVSSMMLWDDDVRHWRYAYNEEELTRRRGNQVAVLEKLGQSGSLFL